MYQKKSQLEHILLRPDTYIGSVELVKELMWVYKAPEPTEEVPQPSTTAGRMVQREISYVPGLYKIYDEILVNAADNKQRDPKMNCIRIDINPETNTISVQNNGKGIPVVMHKEENMYVPTMIFGHLLTSSNYNDDEQKVTGGRNGYGAKLCNIFSDKFVVETASREYKKCFKQTWISNMSKAAEPKIADFRGEDYTKVTFCPDLKKFKMERLDEDIVALMSRRAYDVAASSRGVAVYLNGERLGVKSFKDYIDLYMKDASDDSGTPMKIVYENVSERWEIACALSERGFQQVSFVNSIATTKGGRHIDHVVDAVIKQLIETLNKKNKGGIPIKPFQVKNHMWFFVNCLIVNPTFDSQTKENMTLQSKLFGSKCTISDKFLAGVVKSGLVEAVLTWAKFKADTDLAKTSGGKKSGKLKNVPKLQDANDAGSKNSSKCTLILTEGDSAMSLVVSGLAVVGRDHYGCFPLRGKLLNVREATHKQILENAEINNIIKIVGLQYKKKYLTVEDMKSLRYGKIMIMTDQDQDGSHIKGLVINFLHTNWPELLRLPFLEEFITPIVKATKRDQELSFYSLPEFEEWRADTPNAHTFRVKYFKGLGTSTAKEAKEYFGNMDRHRILFRHDGAQDDEAIVMAFARKCIEQRKEWLTGFMEETKRRKLLGLQEKYLYTKDTKEITYQDFVNLELVLFSNADNVRSIPSVVDGLKPGQRKVMFTCFKRNDKREVKVAQLTGSVAEMSAYHHGEASLSSTIINLAQNYVGSNNINLLVPSGQFGTRLSGGKDSASPRYIFTIMSSLTRLIFHPHDDPLLDYQTDDNQRIEPTYYVPIIPMVLVNGADGIGTGWSTKICNHNPRAIIRSLRNMLQGLPAETLEPWYKNFTGQVEEAGVLRYHTNGRLAKLGDNKIEITDLPIGMWTQTYKENVLEPLLHGTEKVKALLSDYKEYHTDTTVRFVLTLAPGEYENMERNQKDVHVMFKLVSSLSVNSMHAFDRNNCLRRYETVQDIMQEFYEVRLEFYGKRKDYLTGMLEAEAARLTDQARFIVEKCSGALTVENKKRKTLVDELVKRGYRPDPVKEWKKRIAMEDDDAEKEASGEGDDGDDPEDDERAAASKAAARIKADPEKQFKQLSDVQRFDYLLGLSMWMLTEERKNELLKQRDHKLAELATLNGKSPKMLWLEDLEALEQKLTEVEQKERDDELGSNKKQMKAMSAVAAKGGGKGRGAKKSINVGTTLDIYPAKDGELVVYKVPQETLEKYAKMAAGPKKKAIKSEKGDDSQNQSVLEVDDEFDNMVDGQSSRPTVDGEGVKQEVDGEGRKPAVAAAKKPAAARKPAAAKKVAVKKEAKSPKDRKSDGLKQSKLAFNKKVSVFCVVWLRLTGEPLAEW